MFTCKDQVNVLFGLFTFGLRTKRLVDQWTKTVLNFSSRKQDFIEHVKIGSLRNLIEFRYLQKGPGVNI